MDQVTLVQGWLTLFRKYFGVLPRNKVKNLMHNKSDADVCPSIYENCPVAVIEALASGLPVVATKCGGPEDMVSKDTECLFKNESVNGLVDAMLRVYKERDIWKNKQKELISYCRSKFSASTIMPLYHDLYRKLIDKKAK